MDWGEQKVRLTRLVKGRELVELWLDDSAAPGAAKKRGRIEWPDVGRLLEMQTSTLDHKKPGVRIQPSLWVPLTDSAAGTGWQRWRLLYEATHISHMGGLDADISYAIADPTYHFSKEIHRIDAQKSVQWIGLLARAAQDTGVQIEKILVDPRVIALLEASMPKGEPEPPFWGLVAPAKGHDSHLHIRLVPGFQRVAGPADRPARVPRHNDNRRVEGTTPTGD
ncbi:MAG: penicillin-insensitive murein endopeptidase [Phycisphaerales bacterium]|nr:penicillin-insensitive murein endopeptidase [Phycisphaerales bacterium]